MHVIKVHEEYGLVVTALASTALLNTFQGLMVGRSRKEHGVKYPRMYDNENPEGVFNCVQRGHQNTLEQIANVNVLGAIAGVLYPRTSAASIFLWIGARFGYQLAYSTGKPSNRTVPYLISQVSVLALLGANFLTAYKLLK